MKNYSIVGLVVVGLVVLFLNVNFAKSDSSKEVNVTKINVAEKKASQNVLTVETRLEKIVNLMKNRKFKLALTEIEKGRDSIKRNKGLYLKSLCLIGLKKNEKATKSLDQIIVGDLIKALKDKKKKLPKSSGYSYKYMAIKLRSYESKKYNVDLNSLIKGKCFFDINFIGASEESFFVENVKTAMKTPLSVVNGKSRFVTDDPGLHKVYVIVGGKPVLLGEKSLRTWDEIELKIDLKNYITIPVRAKARTKITSPKKGAVIRKIVEIVCECELKNGEELLYSLRRIKKNIDQEVWKKKINMTTHNLDVSNFEAGTYELYVGIVNSDDNDVRPRKYSIVKFEIAK